MDPSMLDDILQCREKDRKPSATLYFDRGIKLFQGATNIRRTGDKITFTFRGRKEEYPVAELHQICD